MNFPAGALSGKQPYPWPVEVHAHPSPTEASEPSSGYESLESFRHGHRRSSAWRQLERDAELPMQSEAFVGSVADYLPGGREIQIYFVNEGDQLTALLPLSEEPGLRGRLKVVGENELGEPSDLLSVSPGATTHLAEAIIGRKRVVDLDRLPEDSPLIAALETAIAGKGKICVRPAKATPTITLNSNWADPSSQFNSGRRSDFRRAARRAAEFGQVEFEILAPTPRTFDALFDQAIGVEARSWKKDKGTAIAVDLCKERFFRNYFRAACARGEFRLAFMRIEGEVVAVQMALECLDRYWLFKIGFDEAYSRCSPGTLLMLHTIGWAAERGLRAYELLGDVEPWIAQLWTRQERNFARVRVYPYNFRGALAFSSDTVTWLRKKIGGVVP